MHGIYVKMGLRSLFVEGRRKMQDGQREKWSCSAILMKASVNIMEGSRMWHDHSEVRSGKTIGLDF